MGKMQSIITYPPQKRAKGRGIREVRLPGYITVAALNYRRCRISLPFRPCGMAISLAGLRSSLAESSTRQMPGQKRPWLRTGGFLSGQGPPAESYFLSVKLFWGTL